MTFVKVGVGLQFAEVTIAIKQLSYRRGSARNID